MEIATRKGLINGLEYMLTLQSLYSLNPPVPCELREPLEALYAHTKKRMKESGRDRELSSQIENISWIPSHLAEAVRNTDERHTIASFATLAEICNGEGYHSVKTEPRKGNLSETKLLLSAIIVHDCAYPSASSYKSDRTKDARITHMHNGAEAFRTFAPQVNSDFKNFYNPQEIEQIANIIEVHDNPSLKKPFDPKDSQIRRLLVHRAADRLWMLDKAGFALDLLRKVISGEECNPAEYLEYVIGRHTDEARLYDSDAKNILSAAGINFQKYDSAFTLYTTNTSFEIFKRSIKNIKQDYSLDSTR